MPLTLPPPFTLPSLPVCSPRVPSCSSSSGHASSWQVDGAGIQKVDDNDLAEKLKARVRNLNFRTTIDAFIVVAFYISITGILRQVFQE